MGERTLLLVNPAAGKRHAEDGGARAERARVRPDPRRGPADWDVPGYSSPEDFLWYESRVFPGIEGLPVAIMCTYDAAQLPAPALLYGALETHSHTMINGVASENPSFLPADRFLKTRLIHLPWLEPDEQRRVNSAWEDRPARGRRTEPDRAEDRDADEEGEDPEQERGVMDVGAVVPNALRLLLLLHRLRDGGEEFLVRLRLAEPLQQELRAFDLTDSREHLPQEDHLPHDLGREQHLLAACA